ncbi:hypothetical protein BOX37_28485 [Nocardia mangyaensis]|uniref:Uncharacterized protein n=1 Tax=Nocardia mangyaensis TaxID=2213200 RepID=A0A1J0VYQ5_9NOCA|nr:hypothetical protein [Nocardia mangyaensis]APE37216.1 hypothetical protein BOX37_28485 [Nocardia mangyaensis]
MSSEQASADAAEALRRKAAETARVARIFGEVLPDTSGDERGEDVRGTEGDEWLRSQIPPHHG